MLENSLESDPLVATDAQVAILGRHKLQCVWAMMLCTMGVLGDFVRWVLLVAYAKGWESFYLRNDKVYGITIGSIVWDVLSVFILVGLYMLHHKWIQLPEYGTWTWLNVLRASTVSRVISMAGMIFGAPYNFAWSVFLFLTQIFFYASVLLPWIGAIQMYIRALHFHPVAMQGIMAQSMAITPERQEEREHSKTAGSATPPSPISPVISLAEALTEALTESRRQSTPDEQLKHSMGGFMRESTFQPKDVNLADSMGFSSFQSAVSSTTSQPYNTPPASPLR